MKINVDAKKKCVGYYGVFLESHGVFAEMTVTGVYTGVHQYTFNNPADKKYLLTHKVHICLTAATT